MKTQLTVILIAIGLLLLSCSDDNITSTRKYRLTTSVSPSESGVVNPSQGEYEEGESVQLTATPNQHWVFDRWEGDYSGTASMVNLMMDSDKNISALFTMREYPLTIIIEGEGIVDETIVQQQTTDYQGGTTVELTAIANEGWRFSHWEGDLASSDNPITIEIDSEKTVTAVFERKDYPLTVNVVGSGTVSEEVVQAKTTEYPYQTTVQITAIPSGGWVFSGWEGDLTGSDNPAHITIEDAKEVTAVFVKDYYSITVTYDGPAMTFIDLISGNQSGEEFEYESKVNIRIEALSGWRFVTWQGDLSGSENPIEIIVKGNIVATAVLEQVPFEGEGTITSPFQIATVEQLQMIREPRFLADHFVQVGDIDASATATWNNGQGFIPIGFLGSVSSDKFTGSYDGGGYQISGLTINQTSGYYFLDAFVGLFGTLDHALVKNLTLNNINITANNGIIGAGGLAGIAKTGSRIENVQVSGTITGYNNVGGLVGILDNGEANTSISDVTLEGNTNIGGLIGNSIASRVNGSNAAGNVTGFQNVGGLIGHQIHSKMTTNLYAAGDVTGSINVGGLIGASFNTTQMIRFAFTTGNVTGTQNTGGLVGFYTGEAVISETYVEGNISSNNGTNIGGLIGRIGAGKVYKSYALGDVSGSTAIGGLVGRNDPDGVISESFSAGLVSGSLQVGGVIGSNQGVLNKSYWDTDTSGQSSPVWDPYQGINEAAGLTTSQMTGSNAQLTMTNFDWVNTWSTSQAYPDLKVFSAGNSIE